MKVQLVRKNGVLKIEINESVYDPLSFKSFRANPQNVSEFYQAGTRLFCVLSSGITSALGVPYSRYGESWVGEYEYDFSAIDKQMDMFIENAPDGYFALMLQVDTREWYLEKHPEVPNSFTHLSQIAHDETWKRQAADYLKAAISYCEKKYGNKIFGYFILGGLTTEWFSGKDFEESHPIKEAGYKKWKNDQSAKLPTLEQLNTRGKVFLEEGEGELYLARKFHAETIADLILYFSAEAQTVLQHKKLLGLYYGYLLELGGHLYNYGALAYEKVYQSADIDMIASPSSYNYRRVEDPSAVMTMAKTLDTHNKLYFLEFDHRTHTCPNVLQEAIDQQDRNKCYSGVPGFKTIYKNEAETLNVMYRDFLLCNAHGIALWWFDMFDGWFRSEGMMNAVKHMYAISKKLGELPTESLKELAVIAEGESLYRTHKNPNLTAHSLSWLQKTLAQSGVAYDLYSVMDLALQEMKQYKAYLFVNQYDIPQTTKELVAKHIKTQGKTAIWLYAPNFATNGMNSAQNIEEWTGIRVAESMHSHGAILFNGQEVDYGLDKPYFSVEDEEAIPLAYFSDGAVAAAYKDIDGYRSVYVATCSLPADLLREIARSAGCTVYSEDSRVYVYANSSSIGVYNASGTEARIKVLQDATYRDLIGGDVYESRDGYLTLKNKNINAYLLIREE